MTDRELIERIREATARRSDGHALHDIHALLARYDATRDTRPLEDEDYSHGGAWDEYRRHAEAQLRRRP